MTKTDKTVLNLLKSRPELIKTQFEWRTLLESLLIQPDSKFEWIKDKKTGEWDKHRI